MTPTSFQRRFPSPTSLGGSPATAGKTTAAFRAMGAFAEPEARRAAASEVAAKASRKVHSKLVEAVRRVDKTLEAIGL